MLNNAPVSELFKIRRCRRHGNSFEIILHILMGIDLPVKRINIEIYFFAFLPRGIREIIVNFEVTKYKLFRNVDRFYRNVQKLTDNEIQNSVSNRIAFF